jgi:glycosyltransferase involved in cell wall biosynthesis
MGLANALCDKVDVEVIHPRALSPICGLLANQGVKLSSFDKPPFRRDPRNLQAIRAAFRLIDKSKPDVLHVQESFDYAYDIYSLIARFPPLITTIHDVVPHPGDGHAAPGLQYSKAISCWRSSKLIVHTDGMRSQLAQRFRVNTKKIDVIPHGELGTLYRHLARSSNEPELPREPQTLLFFGRIWPYKGLRYLLEAFAILKTEIPTARLIIAGKGGDLTTNAQLIRSLQDIELIDSFIPAGKVAGLFERSSVVVLPYIEASQSGVSAIGFTTGTIVVASNVGGLADLIDDQRTGLLVEPRDSTKLASTLVMILKDQEKQSQIRERALALGQGPLNWSAIAESTLATYKAALSGA